MSSSPIDLDSKRNDLQTSSNFFMTILSTISQRKTFAKRFHFLPHPNFLKILTHIRHSTYWTEGRGGEGREGGINKHIIQTSFEKSQIKSTNLQQLVSD